jgi:1-acyl-sn-glycerol-3-phosphate acyltransferase
MTVRRALSILFWTFLALSCVPLFFVALAIFLVTFPFDRKGLVLHLYSCAWAQIYFWINPIWSLSVEGREKLPWKGAAVLVSNHESLGDILVLFGLFRPFKWVSKASVFKVPFIGWNMRLNRYVGVVRGDRESVKKMLAACERWLEAGVPVLLFPEGTRSPDGEVKDFKDGAFTLAISKQVPVIPIALAGTGRTLPKHGFVIRDTARCRVRVLDPVDPAPFGADVERLREHVRGLIVSAKRKMIDTTLP